MKTLARTLATVVFAAVVFASTPAAGGTLVLKKAFVDKYRNRATINANFTVDHAHKKPNAAAKHGDMQCRGPRPERSWVADGCGSNQRSTVSGADCDESNSCGRGYWDCRAHLRGMAALV